MSANHSSPVVLDEWPLRRRGVVLVLVGPSGSGKTTILERLLATDRNLTQIVTCTTREPRDGEIDGIHYHFKTQTEFNELAATEGFLEHATVFGTSYGVPRAQVETLIQLGSDQIIIVDWQGHRTLKTKLHGDLVSVFIIPPSLEELETRLVARGDKREAIEKRVAGASAELAHWAETTHCVVNSRLEHAIEQVRGILAAARLETRRYCG